MSFLAATAYARLGGHAGWREVAPGFEYQRLSLSAAEGRLRAQTHLHALRVDPARYRLGVVSAGVGQTATARQMVAGSGALAAVNGGFFDENFRPLGLRVSRGKVVYPLRRADWGVFYLQGGQPKIAHTRDYRPDRVTEAIQCGPRLVVNGQITRLKPQSARRTAVGIDASGRVLLVVTEGADLDATQFARALSAPESTGGLGCRDALNLDGGPSTQMHAVVGNFRLHLPGTWGVPDGLAVFRR